MNELKGVMGSATFDGRVVTITRGRMAAAGRGTKTIPVSQITGVQLKPATLTQRGWIEFTIPGAVEVSGKTSVRDALDRENVVVFARSHRDDAEAFRDAVLSALT